MRALAEAVREEREAKGWTIEDLATRSNLQVEEVERLEKGEEQPTIENLLGLAYALELPVSTFSAFFIGRDDDLEDLTYHSRLLGALYRSARRTLQ